MMKRFNMAQIRCPVDLYEEVIAVSFMKKVANWHRKQEKT